MAAKKQSSFWLTGRKTAEASVLQKLILYIKKKIHMFKSEASDTERRNSKAYLGIYILNPQR